MSYVCLRTADILPRESKNNVLQWFVQFLMGPPVPIRRCNIKNIRVTRCDTWPPGGFICLSRDTGPFCYFTDSESAAALAASHAAPAL